MAVRPGLIVTRAVELDHTHGHWCRACLLGTGIRAIVGVTMNNHPVRVSEMTWCPECGGNDIEVIPDAHHC